jgi:hypothetical protein
MGLLPEYPVHDHSAGLENRQDRAWDAFDGPSELTPDMRRIKRSADR